MSAFSEMGSIKFMDEQNQPESESMRDAVEHQEKALDVLYPKKDVAPAAGASLATETCSCDQKKQCPVGYFQKQYVMAKGTEHIYLVCPGIKVCAQKINELIAAL
jgi:hypothetical protein